uniref:Uncharacterized protein n=1 Tax=Pithovirus LCPAC406 TaxID=2506599 RepID=A0A481ZGE0_9VIRU|nr:MAG: hypothetical protein LCPAC406_02340 [Pithovirus LCPAC406]
MGRGYNIAVPGFDSNNIKLSPKIMKYLTESGITTRNRAIKDMNLIGLQGLVTSAVTKSNMSMREPIIISSKNSNYEYVNTDNVISIIERIMNVGATGSLLINNGEPINFIVGDVLNEGSRPFKINTVIKNEVEITFVPKYPIIELMDHHLVDDMIYQVKNSFYGEYYEAEMKSELPIRSVSSPRKSHQIQTSLIIPRSSRIRKSKLRVISKPRIRSRRTPF